MTPTKKQRIWGWFAFDWASQPFFTLGVTFIFGPYFAEIAMGFFERGGSAQPEADAQALWSLGQTLAGVLIAVMAPLLGAVIDNSGRKIPWMIGFSLVFVASMFGVWGLTPDGANLVPTLIMFFIGFIAVELALNVINAFMPSLGTDDEVGELSGTALALGYWGGVVSLAFFLLFMAEDAKGVTLLGNPPLFGLDPDAREGTRSVGPFIALWYMVFMVPFFLWVRDTRAHAPTRQSVLGVLGDLGHTIRRVAKRRSLAAFLLSSMFYRDGLNALYLFGGVYAKLVLGWTIIQIGTFGVVGAITAAIVTWGTGQIDRRIGPKPVIRGAVLVLIGVSAIIIGMSRESIFGISVAPDSALPDILFYICGACIGGAGGAVYGSSRSLMVRHADPDRPTEAFGLFALTGKATAFLAPAMITVVTATTGSNQWGFAPVVGLFVLGLVLLRWVNPEGDRNEWSDTSSS